MNILACSFDESMCGFVQGVYDTFDWTRYRGSALSSDNGPFLDHTTGNMTGELSIFSVKLGSPTVLLAKRMIN